MCILTLSAIGTALGSALGISAISTGVTAGSIGAAVGGGTLAGIGIMAAETIGVGATIAGGIASTIGGIQQQQAIAAQAEFQAKVEDENAKIAAQSSEANKLQANQKRLALLNQMQQMQGHIRSDFAGRGVVLGSGTPNDFEADLADSYDMDRRNLEYDVASRSWQYKVQETGHRQQADLYRAQAKGARALIPGVAAGGLLSTAGNLMNSGLSSFSLGTELGLFGKGAEAANAPIQGAWGSAQSTSNLMVARSPVTGTVAPATKTSNMFGYLGHSMVNGKLVSNMGR